MSEVFSKAPSKIAVFTTEDDPAHRRTIYLCPPVFYGEEMNFRTHRSVVMSASSAAMIAWWICSFALTIIQAPKESLPTFFQTASPVHPHTRCGYR